MPAIPSPTISSEETPDQGFGASPRVSASAREKPATESAEGKFGPTLDEVRKIIPADCFERKTWRGLSIVARDIAFYGIALWGLIAVHSFWLSLPVIFAAGLVISGMFVTGHDAAHGALVPGKKLNRALALVMMLPSLHVRDAWDLGHNRIHHGFTVRQGIDFVWHPLTTEQYGKLSRLGRMRHRLEWSFVGSGAYYLREVWWNKMMRFDPPERFKKSIRRDWWVIIGFSTAAICGAFAVGLAQGGNLVFALWSVLKIVVLPFLVFTHIIGWTVHVHHVQPDTRWYTSKQWTKFKAQMEGTTILRIPRILDLFFHDIFVHVPHHVDMRIPCYKLRKAASAITAAFPGVVVDRKFRVRDYLSATRQCKLYDFELGTWVGYKAALARLSETGNAVAGT